MLNYTKSVKMYEHYIHASAHTYTHTHTHTPLIFWGLTVQPASSHSFSVVKTYTVVIGEVHILFSKSRDDKHKGPLLSFSSLQYTQ